MTELDDFIIGELQDQVKYWKETIAKQEKILNDYKDNLRRAERLMQLSVLGKQKSKERL